jgi:alkanesulfonate monooxygenase SsuD/methylene tetrahydromethanopterin reductase-like flavin-dependent oxidoreductase (luciferase family)
MTIEIGVSLPVFLARYGSNIPDFPAVARHAEDVGLDAVWSGDHLTTGAPLLESTVALTAAAAGTSRIRLGYAVMLLALRQPAWAAKQISSLQLVSGNRLVLGVGVGGQWPDEWAAAGVEVRTRARRTDAILEYLPGLLAGEPTRLTTEPGAPEVTLAPGVPMPPLWVGGASEAALRRTVRVGQGWLGSMITPAELGAQARTLAALAEEAGVAVPQAGVIVFAALSAGESGDGDGFVRYLSKTYGLSPEYAAEVVVNGPPAALAERLDAYAAAGASQVVVATFGADVQSQYDLVARARTALVGG